MAAKKRKERVVQVTFKIRTDAPLRVVAKEVMEGIGHWSVIYGEHEEFSFALVAKPRAEDVGKR